MLKKLYNLNVSQYCEKLGTFGEKYIKIKQCSIPQTPNSFMSHLM